MKINYFTYFLFIIIILTLLSLAGCGGGSSSGLLPVQNGQISEPVFSPTVAPVAVVTPVATPAGTHVSTPAPASTPVSISTETVIPVPSAVSTPASEETAVSESTPTASPVPSASPVPASTPPINIQGCAIFPSDNVWNIPVDNMPVDINSTAYVNTIGASRYVHADFGSGTWNGGPIGIPYNIVPGIQPKVNISFDYAGESDRGPYPIPSNPLIEGGPDATGDRHVLLVDKDNCILYELYCAVKQTDGSWHAGSGAIFDLKSNNLRPDSWTSADAAGLAILPGLVRYDEIESGEIRHAIRFTVPQTRKAYIWPARHYASNLTSLQYPPMGQRFRLKSSFDISGFSIQARIILIALKKYGMILADNGSSWYISGVPDERWDNDMLHELHKVPGSAFEAVDESSLMMSPDSGQVKLR